MVHHDSVAAATCLGEDSAINRRRYAAPSFFFSLGGDLVPTASARCLPFYHTERSRLAHEVFIRYVQNDMDNSPAILYAESFICPRQVRAKPYQAMNMAEVSKFIGR